MPRSSFRYLQTSKPQKSCGKNRYKSEQEARLVADQQEMLFASENLHLNIYHCSFCGGWHLTKRL